MLGLSHANELTNNLTYICKLFFRNIQGKVPRDFFFCTHFIVIVV